MAEILPTTAPVRAQYAPRRGALAPMDAFWILVLAASAASFCAIVAGGASWRLDAGVCLGAALLFGAPGLALALVATSGVYVLFAGAIAPALPAGLVPLVFGLTAWLGRRWLPTVDVADSRFALGVAALIGIASAVCAGMAHWATPMAMPSAAVELASAGAGITGAVLSAGTLPDRRWPRGTLVAGLTAVCAVFAFSTLPEFSAGTLIVFAVGAGALYCAGRGRVFGAFVTLAAATVAAGALTSLSPVPHLLVLTLAMATVVVLANRTRLDRFMQTQGANAQLFDSMMRFLPIGIFRVDTQGTMRYANPMFQTLTGLDGDSTRGWRDVIVAADRDRIDAAWNDFQSNRANFDQQFRVQPLGNLRWLNVRVTPEYDRGNVIGYIGTVTDISSQRVAEEERRRTEAHSQAVLDNAVDAIITIDRAGLIRSFNKAAQRIFGYTSAEVIGHNVSLLMPHPHRQQHDQYIENYLRTGNARIIGIGRELEARLKDGRTIPIYLAVSEVSLGGERHFTGLVRDISRERAAAEEIRRQNEQLSLTVQNAPMGIATYRFGHPFAATNRAFQLTMGLDETQLRDRTLLDLVHDDDRDELERLVQQSAAGLLAQFSLRVRARRADGSVVHLATHHAVTHDAQGNPDLVILQAEDLTGAMQAVEAEREHRERLTHVARLSTLGEMTAGIAHEINQPLTAIAMYAQSGVRMLDSGNPNPARLREALVKLNAQSLRAGAVIDRIQRLVRNHDGVRETIDINELVNDILRLAESDARVNDIQISLDLAERVPLVRADPIQIQQVLLNLVRNGIDAMRSIGCRNGDQVIIRTQLNRDAVQVAVVDSGTGVAADFAAQLFTPFATTKDSGMGMGLSICRSIIEDHGGRLAYANNERFGATFYFDLPRENRDDD
jgi:two-component system sensor kinase FixL